MVRILRGAEPMSTSRRRPTLRDPLDREISMPAVPPWVREAVVEWRRPRLPAWLCEPPIPFPVRRHGVDNRRETALD